MKCDQGHVQTKTFDSFQRGKRCGQCNIYKNEEECREIIQEITCLEFKNQRPKFLKGLELDGFNKDLKLAFEYQGEQHYKRLKHWQTLKQFVHQVCRDKVKIMLCKENDVDLIIIPYHIEDKREFILKEFIAISNRVLD